MAGMVSLVGIGMGTQDTLTKEAGDILEDCGILIGASRMLAVVPERILKNVKIFQEYRAEEIASFLRQQKFEKAAVLLSGDSGFYSGAKKLLEKLSDFQTAVIPGISSVSYFCSRLKCAWEDVCLVSLHGKKCNVISNIRTHEKVFCLMDGSRGLKELCEKLLYYGMKDVRLFVGTRLSYPEERIRSGTPEEFLKFEEENLLVLLAENPAPQKKVGSSIPDEAFIRGEVPMTKEVVRMVSIGKMKLEKDSIVYDVGAGTGSVSVEMALVHPEIMVYAIEKKEAAISLLVENKRKFCADNMEIIHGTAPEAIEGLPCPTHAFIGGSSGKIGEILECIFKKNPMCQVVANIIALNTLTDFMEFCHFHPEYETELIQLQASVSKKLGEYQMMMGQNPVYVVRIWKKW